MSVTLPTARSIAYHEGAHCAAMLLGSPRVVPRAVRIDFPNDRLAGTLAGYTEVDWGDGITEASAAVVLQAVICGGAGEGGPWASWPLKVERFPHECRRDVEQCQTLCAYLKVESLGDWLWHKWRADQMWKRQDFRRLLISVASELERVEVLHRDTLIDLLEAEQCSG